MPRFMFDTDISSYIMKRSSNALLLKLETVPPEDVCISSITKSELSYGVEVSPRKARNGSELDTFLKYVDVLDYPGNAAIDYAQIRAFLRASGTMIGANDLLIAAHARCLGLALITNNTREFARVPGLKIENWT